MEIRINEPWITDKVRIQNGYAYIDHPFWNAEKQQADHKREYIGKYDGTSFKPNKNFQRLKAEYEAELAEYNERKREAAAPAPTPAPAPAERCPFSSSLSGECNEKCALRTAHGCAIAFLVERAPSVDTVGRKCPFSNYPCTERCALYQQHGCVLTAF